MRKKERFRFILVVLGCLMVASGLALYALRDNISYFFTPHEVYELQKKADPRVQDGKVFRLGGLVKQGSLEKTSRKLTIRFVVTDNIDDMPVEYMGIPPDLFREGQGVVAKGSLAGLKFVATELLAKHDEKYTPPELDRKMKKMHEKGKAAE
jgi:cytochrome c-type biogenesis protein CcmE